MGLWICTLLPVIVGYVRSQIDSQVTRESQNTLSGQGSVNRSSDALWRNFDEFIKIPLCAACNFVSIFLKMKFDIFYMDYGGAKFYGMQKNKVVFHIGKFRFGLIYRRFQRLFVAETNDG